MGGHDLTNHGRGARATQMGGTGGTPVVPTFQSRAGWLCHVSIQLFGGGGEDGFDFEPAEAAEPEHFLQQQGMSGREQAKKNCRVIGGMVSIFPR